MREVPKKRRFNGNVERLLEIQTTKRLREAAEKLLAQSPGNSQGPWNVPNPVATGSGLVPVIRPVPGPVPFPEPEPSPSLPRPTPIPFPRPTPIPLQNGPPKAQKKLEFERE